MIRSALKGHHALADNVINGSCVNLANVCLPMLKAFLPCLIRSLEKGIGVKLDACWLLNWPAGRSWEKQAPKSRAFRRAWIKRKGQGYCESHEAWAGSRCSTSLATALDRKNTHPALADIETRKAQLFTQSKERECAISRQLDKGNCRKIVK